MQREETLREIVSLRHNLYFNNSLEELFVQGSDPLPPVAPDEPLPPLAPEEPLPPLAPEGEPLPPLAPEEEPLPPVAPA